MKVHFLTNSQPGGDGITYSYLPNKNKKIILWRDGKKKYFKYDNCVDAGTHWVLSNSNQVLRVTKK
jgi:hypothetical protein